LVEIDFSYIHWTSRLKNGYVSTCFVEPVNLFGSSGFGDRGSSTQPFGKYCDANITVIDKLFVQNLLRVTAKLCCGMSAP